MTLEQAIETVEQWRKDDPRRFDAEAAERVHGWKPCKLDTGEDGWTRPGGAWCGYVFAYHDHPAADYETLLKVREWVIEDQWEWAHIKWELHNRNRLVTASPLTLAYAPGDYTAAALAVLLAKEDQP